MTHQAITFLGNGLLGMGILCLTRSRLLSAALYALAGFVFYIDDALTHNAFGQILQAVWTTYWAWRWWKGGGGDNTKRRLKKWARKFTAVRRTAPQLT